MARALFPIYAVPAGQSAAAPLPIYRDVSWDAEAGRERWSGGNPVIVSGAEAVKSWVWRAIATERYKWAVFSWDYGCELERLVGYPYRADTKRSEAVRYVTEALLVNPYIESCRVYDVTFDGSTLHMRVEYTTPYGRDAIYV